MNKCAFCSFNESEHDRAMFLSHPLYRHAFVEPSAPIDDELSKTAAPATASQPRISYPITGNAFETLTPSPDFKFRGLGQIYEGEDPNPGSAIGILATVPFNYERGEEGSPTAEQEEQERKQKNKQRKRQGPRFCDHPVVRDKRIKLPDGTSITKPTTEPCGVEISSYRPDADLCSTHSVETKSQEQQEGGQSASGERRTGAYSGRYATWQEAISSIVQPHALIRHRETGDIFEIYKHNKGFLYVGSGRPEHRDPQFLDLSVGGRVYKTYETPKGKFLARVPGQEDFENFDHLGPEKHSASIASVLHEIMADADAIPDKRHKLETDEDHELRLDTETMLPPFNDTWSRGYGGAQGKLWSLLRRRQRVLDEERGPLEPGPQEVRDMEEEDPEGYQALMERRRQVREFDRNFTEELERKDKARKERSKAAEPERAKKRKELVDRGEDILKAYERAKKVPVSGDEVVEYRYDPATKKLKVVKAPAAAQTTKPTAPKQETPKAKPTTKKPVKKTTPKKK